MALAGHLSTLGGDAAQPACDAARLLGLERRATTEVALVEAHHPPEPGLERRDPRAELVAVQRQPRLEAQRVARTEAGGGDPGVDQALPPLLGRAHRDVQLDAVLTCVAGARDPAPLAVDVERRDPEPAHLRVVGCDRREPGTRLGPLHREHDTVGGDVDDRALPSPVHRGGVEQRARRAAQCSRRSASR